MDQQLRLLLELWEPLTPLNTRKMFGGYGVFKDGLMFAIFIRGMLYFKVDPLTMASFHELTLKPFTYERLDKSGNKKIVELSFFEAPLDIYDEPDMAILWARNAIGAALRVQSKSSH